MEAPNLNYLWASLVVEELVRNGVATFVIAPGSRSAPLAVSAFENARARCLVHYDERGSAFFALGCARMGNPAAVICTSGTAVANCFPAVTEASAFGLPLIILSADRPPELQACAANQTLDQHHIFGRYTRAHVDLPCPDLAVSPEALLTRVDAALAAGLGNAPGPVHFNCMFREPLAPTPVAGAWPESYLKGVKSWQETDVPLTRWETAPYTLSSCQCTDIISALSSSETGLLVIGRLHTRAEQTAALNLANRLGWPVFADITSGCRRSDLCPGVVPHYDLLLRSAVFREYCIPDRILHIGDVFLSKQLQEHLSALQCAYIHISPRSDNRDPLHRVTHRYQVDIVAACEQIAGSWTEQPSSRNLGPILSASETVHQYLQAAQAAPGVLTELSIACLVDTMLPAEWSLFLGNSMPVRDMDMAAYACRAEVTQANRGVSGIDGNLATAAGMGWSSGSGVVAVIGDTALLHDLNSLSLLAAGPSPIILVVVNNRGGGIFAFLPIGAHTDVLEPCFINPHPWQFRQVAEMFTLQYACVDTAESFNQAFQNALESRGSTVIEVLVDRAENLNGHRQCYNEVVKRVDSCVK